jgi:hypothetical protein
MTALLESVPVGDLRAKIVQLRHEIATTTVAYRAAHKHGQAEQVTQLLRQRSTLIRELFQTQSRLLQSFRLDVAEPHPASEALVSITAQEG